MSGGGNAAATPDGEAPPTPTAALEFAKANAPLCNAENKVEVLSVRGGCVAATTGGAPRPTPTVCPNIAKAIAAVLLHRRAASPFTRRRQPHPQ